MIKKNLIYVPIVGWICYALNFPRLDRSGTSVKARHHRDLAAGQRIQVGVRPEKLLISTEPPTGSHLTVTRGVVEDLAYYGARCIYRVRSVNDRIIQVASQNYRRSADLLVEWDDEVYLSWDQECSVVLED